MAISITLAIVFPYKKVTNLNETVNQNTLYGDGDGDEIIVVVDGHHFSGDGESFTDNHVHVVLDGDKVDVSPAAEDTSASDESSKDSTAMSDTRPFETSGVLADEDALAEPPANGIFDSDIAGGSVASSTTTQQTTQDESKATSGNVQTATMEDASSCTTFLRQADVNADGMVDSTEYVYFIDILRKRLPQTNVTTTAMATGAFSELSYTTRINFVHLSCQCDDCCQGNSRGIFIGPEETIPSTTVQTTRAMSIDDICTETIDVLKNP